MAIPTAAYPPTPKPLAVLTAEVGLNAQRVVCRGKCLRVGSIVSRPIMLQCDQEPHGPGRNKADDFAVSANLLPIPANRKRRAVHRIRERKVFARLQSSVKPTSRGKLYSRQQLK